MPRQLWVMLPRPFAAGLLSIVFGASAACAPGGGPATPIRTIEVVGNPAPASPSPSPLPHLQALPSPSPIALDMLVALAVADAAQRTGLQAGEVVAQRVEPHDWPDRSLGCPRPGLGYAQVITPGFLIVVQVRGRQLEYHSDEVQVMLCDT